MCNIVQWQDMKKNNALRCDPTMVSKTPGVGVTELFHHIDLHDAIFQKQIDAHLATDRSLGGMKANHPGRMPSANGGCGSKTLGIFWGDVKATLRFCMLLSMSVWLFGCPIRSKNVKKPANLGCCDQGILLQSGFHGNSPGADVVVVVLHMGFWHWYTSLVAIRRPSWFTHIWGLFHL